MRLADDLNHYFKTSVKSPPAAQVQRDGEEVRAVAGCCCRRYLGPIRRHSSDRAALAPDSTTRSCGWTC